MQGSKEWDIPIKSRIKCVPAIADGKIFFGSWDGTLFVLNTLSGSEIWKTKAKKAIYSSPLFHQERLYYSSWDGYLYAAQAKSGKTLWKFKAKDAISITPVIYDNIIFAGSLDGYVYAVDTRDGTELWKIETGWAGTHFPPVIDKKTNLIFIANNNSNIYALEPFTGKVKWKFATQWSGIYTDMVLIENMLFVPSFDGTLYCLEAKNGKLIWSLPLGKFFLANPPSQDEKLFLATEHGELAAVNIYNGNILWRYKIAERIYKKPQLFEDALFLASDQGYLYGVDILFGEVIFQYIIDYYSDYFIHYDYNSEMFYFFNGEDKLLSFGKVKEKEELDVKETYIAKREFIKPPNFSPDGKYILYNNYQIKSDNNLYRAHFTDNNTLSVVKLTQSGADDIFPMWCPDSTAIVFSSNRDGNYNLYKMYMTNLDIYYFDDKNIAECNRSEKDTLSDLNNYTVEDMEKKYNNQLTNERGDDFFPVPSPDGSKILYSSNINGNWDLFVMDSSGQNKTRLTFDPADEEYASWSPDGKKIIFTSSRIKDKDVYMIDCNVNNLMQVTHDEVDEIHPKWIGDSSIVYEKMSIDKRYSNIWITQENGENGKALTEGKFRDAYPIPSPDGKKIAFISNRKDDRDNIWSTNISSNGLIQITNYADEVNPPSWSFDNKKIIFFVKDSLTGNREIKTVDINQFSLLEFFKQAENFLYKGEYEEARNIYQNIIENYPDYKVMVLVEPAHFNLSSHLSALYKMSVIEERRNNIDNMTKLRKTIAEDKSGDGDEQKKFSLITSVKIKIAEQLAKKEKYIEAIDSYTDILKDYKEMKDEFGYPVAPYIMIRMAECYEKTSEYEHAIDLYIKAQEEYPDEYIMINKDYIGTMAHSFVMAAKIYEKQFKNYDKALEYYLKILEKHSDDKYTNKIAVLKAAYIEKALINIRRIYSRQKIDTDKWFKLCKNTYGVIKNERLKKSFENIINDLERLKNGESLMQEKDQVSKVVFCSRKKEGDLSENNFEIYSMTENGTDTKRLTYNDANDYRPNWSPGGDKIVYHTLFESNYEIFVMDNDGANQMNLTNNAAYDFEPAWNSDGTRISFTTDRDKNMEIYVMNEDGSDPINISSHPARDFESNWSPFGDKIVFTTDRDGNLEVYQIDIANGTIENLSKSRADDHEPVFSPDGLKIIFTSNRDGNEEIYIMNNDGREQYNISKNDSFDYNPTWSKDGQYIFFVSNRHGTPKIFRMRSDGTGIVQLTGDAESYDIQPNVTKGIQF
ncbi:PD40 domain-containing protein [Candidatus Desantisbacteria bacterium]|nr:PD40 domain-containing protein [Candidatus Desantisbacteria bacterium]